MPEATKARIVGFNHVALEVGDIEAALAFYARLFEFKLRGKSDSMAFIDDNGDEQIYWFPYEMILDGDTGAIEYVPLT